MRYGYQSWRDRVRWFFGKFGLELPPEHRLQEMHGEGMKAYQVVNRYAAAR